MTVSYNWLKSFFNSPLPEPKKLAEILTMHCFEVESVEKKGSDYVLNIDVLPDRAGDCLSHLGVAKEISALLDKKIVLPAVKIKENEEKINDYLSVKVENYKDCPRYTARVLKNVKVMPSPKWLKEKLAVCGMNSINNVVDATNYVMLETGQPLHAFDYKKISKEIIVRRAKKGEKILTLSEKEYVLDENILLIADSKKPLALAGIKGGMGCEITGKTRTIVLESANFNPKLVSQTARKLNLRTDASIRFENNLNPNLTESAIDRVASLIQELSGAEVVSGVIDAYKNKLKPWTVKLSVENVNNVIGVEISKIEMVKILTKLGFVVASSEKDTLIVKVPTSRQDITIPENLIEEIGRIYGYEKVPSTLPCFSEPAQRNENLYWQNRAKDIMKELGFVEAYNYSFIGDEEKNLFGLKAEEIVNPVSNYYKYLRPTAVPQMVKIIKENLKFFKDIRVFELGRTFVSRKEIMVLAGTSTDSFDVVKEYLNTLFNKLGVGKASFSTIGKNNVWNSKKTAAIKISGKVVGHLGSLSADITNAVFFEIDFDELQKHCSEKKEYEQISYHPSALRDISGVVLDKLKIEEIMRIIKKSGGKLLKSAEVFDVYKGKGIASGKKSVSFHLTYQSDEKTLDSKTIDSLIKDLINKLKETINWEERK